MSDIAFVDRDSPVSKGLSVVTHKVARILCRGAAERADNVDVPCVKISVPERVIR